MIDNTDTQRHASAQLSLNEPSEFSDMQPSHRSQEGHFYHSIPFTGLYQSPRYSLSIDTWWFIHDLYSKSRLN